MLDAGCGLQVAGCKVLDEIVSVLESLATREFSMIGRALITAWSTAASTR